MSATAQRRWTEAEVRQLIEDAPTITPRYELVDGELLVTPTPSRDHQRVLREVARALDTYLRRRRVGEVLFGPVDLRLAPELVLQPDLHVLRLVNGRRMPNDMVTTRLLLAIEIVSPPSAHFDRFEKRRAYLAAGVPEYWVIDVNSQLVERWQPGDTRPELLDREMVWQPSEPNGVEPLVLDVEAVFRDVRLQGD